MNADEIEEKTTIEKKSDKIKKKSDNKTSSLIILAWYFILIILLILLFGLNIYMGSAKINIHDLISVLVGKGSTLQSKIIWNIRIPRAFAAMLLGGALSISGYLLQTFFSNPIAGPFVLGISHAAKLSVALVMILMLNHGVVVNSWMLITAAFLGAMLAIGFILAVSGKVNRMSILVICGVMIGYICSAITDFVVTFADDSNIVNLHNWSLGSFSGMTMDNVKIILIVVAIGLFISVFLSKPISAYQLGESQAKSLGVNIKLFRAALVILSGILSATVTAFAGPISFVGIAVPHIIRNLFKTSKPGVIIPGCFLGGGVFCLFCDLIARTVFAPTELSISSVTSIFGAPVVIAMMIKRQRKI